MASIPNRIKTIPAETAYFINVASLQNKVFNYNPAATQPVFSTSTWANQGATSSLMTTAGQAILKDLGRTVVSSLRTFRKVQLVVSSISSGTSIGASVASQTGATGTPVTGEEYYTGYIEVVGAYGSIGTNIAPVARLG